MSNPKKWRTTIRIIRKDSETVRELRGRVAQTIIALVAVGNNGVTALEMSSWAFRLADYIHTLRDDHGLEIDTQREEHEGGWHARYVLITAVEILEVSEPSKT